MVTLIEWFIWSAVAFTGICTLQWLVGHPGAVR